MSSPNFSLYFDSLLDMKRGEPLESFSKRVVENLEDWGYIFVFKDEIVITQKGFNVLEFYLRNREFMDSCTSDIQESIIQTVST